VTRARQALPLLATLALSACATAAAPPQAPAPTGYLGKAAAEGFAAQVAPPPQTGSAADLADAQAVRAAQVPLASPRALVAQADAELDPESAIALFDCAVGAQLEAPSPPALTRLFTRELIDAADAWTAAKARFPFRWKPNVALKLEPCTDQPPKAAPVSAYPAGHAVTAELWSRTLAELAPDRAAELAARARGIGESRVICALQYPSDVEAGAKLGAALFEAIRTTPDFQADLKAARAEVAAARASGRVNPGCLAEKTALAG
jgi:acid phosphatase (class A)